MFVILINCVTLGMYQPCDDNPCTSIRCSTLEIFEHSIYIFFAFEMIVKVIAMGFIGKKTYLGEIWNVFDFLIVVLG